MLAFLTVDNGGTGILAERQDALDGRFCIAEELEGYIFVVVRGLGVTQNLCNLLVVCTAQHELAVMETLLCHQRKRLRRHLQQRFVASLYGFYKFFRSRNLIVFRCVRAQLKHGRVFKICHKTLGLPYKDTKKSGIFVLYGRKGIHSGQRSQGEQPQKH